MPESADPLEQLGADEVRSRATSGAALLGARSALIYVFGFGANLALARLLVPRDFGVVTLGQVVLVAGMYLGEAGAGAAFIRREQAPTRPELEATAALQLAIASALAVAGAAIAAPFGRDGLIVAVMVASLPITAFRSPYVVVLERRLRYRAIATADVVEAVSYYGWALATVALGLGVWGLASAVVVRALAGTATMVAVGTLGIVRPRWRWHLVEPVIGFGARFQLNALLYIVRDYGVNVLVALVAGLSTLGVWNLAWRVLQVPNLLFMTIGRVSFPAVSRLMGAGHEMRPAIERGVATLAALTALVAAALVGFAPALPSIVGPGWSDVPSVLLWSGVALLAGAPVAFATTGYLLAADDVGRVALATVVSTVAWFAVTAVTLSRYGAAAVGIGWAASMAVIAPMLWRRAAVRSGARIASRLLAPTAVGFAGVAAGWLVAHAVEPPLAGGALGAATGELVVLAGLGATSRSALADLRSLIRQAFWSFRPPAERAGSAYGRR